MTPQIDEQARTLSRNVGEFAKLHVDLARAELRAGSARFAIGFIVLTASVFVASLATVAFAVALFFALRALLSTILAAILVGIVLSGLAALGFYLGWRFLREVRSLSLPRTREMVGELLQWRDDQTNS